MMIIIVFVYLRIECRKKPLKRAAFSYIQSYFKQSAL